MRVRRPETTTTTDLELLKGLKSLSWLSATQLKELSEAMSVRNVKRDGVIFQELGKPSTEQHILLSGAAQLAHLDGGGPRAVAMMMPGLIFGLPQMPREVGHNFEWIALSDSRVGRLPVERYIAITLGVDYKTYLRVVEPVGNHLGHIIARYPSFIGFTLLRRVAIALLELANEFGVPNHRGVTLRILPTHKQIADLVGASRPKVSEIMNDLKRRRVLVRENGKLTIAPKRLETIVADNASG